jgi:hypothetical protein
MKSTTDEQQQMDIQTELEIFRHAQLLLLDYEQKKVKREASRYQYAQDRQAEQQAWLKLQQAMHPENFKLPLFEQAGVKVPLDAQTNGDLPHLDDPFADSHNGQHAPRDEGTLDVLGTFSLDTIKAAMPFWRDRAKLPPSVEPLKLDASTGYTVPGTRGSWWVIVDECDNEGRYPARPLIPLAQFGKIHKGIGARPKPGAGFGDDYYLGATVRVGKTTYCLGAKEAERRFQAAKLEEAAGAK